VRVLVSHCDHRPFEVERFGAAWVRAGGDTGDLVFVTPSTVVGLAPPKAGFDGLLLTGGPDLEPWRFGAEPEPGVELRLDPPRDALDLELLGRAALESWPVLAVCYGCQLLAVSAGGTVIQDLERAGRGGHLVPEPKDHLAHDVIVDAKARFLAPAGGRFAVNSRHNQAVAEPGGGLLVAARAPDGVIEAIESEAGDRFVLGVQWHPENLSQQAHVTVLRSFRSACLASASRSGPRATVRAGRW
jgi:putative glutamine amidotransferase